MFLLILVQIYKKNRGKPHVERNIYKEKTYIIRWRLIFCMKKEDFQPLNATLFYRKVTELSHVGKLSEVREVRGKLRDKCPTFYAK